MGNFMFRIYQAVSRSEPDQKQVRCKLKFYAELVTHRNKPSLTTVQLKLRKQTEPHALYGILMVTTYTVGFGK